MYQGSTSSSEEEKRPPKYVQGNPKIRVEGKQGIRNSWEKLGESECFCRKCRKGPMRDNAVRVIAKDVFASWSKDGGAMEAGREVGSEKRPDWKRAKKIGAVRESARVSSAGKQDIYEVGNEDRPD